MINKGVATFTLDYGKCPPWLWQRMVKLALPMMEIMVEEYGPNEVIRRLGNPAWFQSLGTVLAFDWNASGLTTILTAALKESIAGHERDLGVFICGGKGKTSLKTPQEITAWGEALDLDPTGTESMIYNSKMAAKVDSSLVQDGFSIYHHAFFFSENGAWTVVQQGMNTDIVAARRYHWHSEDITDLVVEPHSGIATQANAPTLDLTAEESKPTQDMSVELVQGGYQSLWKDIEILHKHSSDLVQTLELNHRKTDERRAYLNLGRKEFSAHPVMKENFATSKYLQKILNIVTELKPETYEELVALQGVGPKTIRALALVSEVIYGAKPSYEDPARYSFAHGGKDATPYPVDKRNYDASIAFFQQVVQKLKISETEKRVINHRLTPKPKQNDLFGDHLPF